MPTGTRLDIFDQTWSGVDEDMNDMISEANEFGRLELDVFIDSDNLQHQYRAVIIMGDWCTPRTDFFFEVVGLGPHFQAALGQALARARFLESRLNEPATGGWPDTKEKEKQR